MKNNAEKTLFTQRATANHVRKRHSYLFFTPFKGQSFHSNGVKGALIIIALLLSFAVSRTALAFPKSGAGHSEGVIQGSQIEEQSAPQPSPEEIEQLEKLRRAGMEEARKIVAAKVNDTPITMEQVITMMNRLAAATRQAPTTPEGIEAVKKDAIDRLILQELAYQKAKADGLKVEQQDIDNALVNLIASLGEEDEAYSDFLKKEMLTEEELKARIERDLLLEMIFTREVLDKAAVPADVVRKEYEAVKDKYILPEKIEVTDVLFLLDIKDKKSMEKAKEILKIIRADKNKDPWNLVLDGSFIVRYYDIKKEREPILYKEAKKLKPGQLSGIIKTDKNLHIIKLKTYSPERQLTFDEVKGSIEGKFRYEAQMARLKEWESELRKDAKIEIFETENKKEDSSQTTDEKK